MQFYAPQILCWVCHFFPDTHLAYRRVLLLSCQCARYLTFLFRVCMKQHLQYTHTHTRCQFQSSMFRWTKNSQCCMCDQISSSVAP